MMMEKVIVSPPTTRRADQHRLGRGLERIARAVILFQQVFGTLRSWARRPIPSSIPVLMFGTCSM